MAFSSTSDLFPKALSYAVSEVANAQARATTGCMPHIRKEKCISVAREYTFVVLEKLPSLPLVSFEWHMTVLTSVVLQALAPHCICVSPAYSSSLL